MKTPAAISAFGRLRDVICVAGHSIAGDFRNDIRTAALGKFERLENQHARTLADDEAEHLDGTPTTIIGCIGDGSCFFHACLKALSPEYRAADGQERRRMAKHVRSEFALDLAHRDPDTGLTLYETLAGGSFAALAEAGVVNTFIPEEPMTYDLASLQQRLRDPGKYVGDETWLLASTIMHVNLVITKRDPSRPTGLKEYMTIEAPDQRQETIVLVGDFSHFELVARRNAYSGDLESELTMEDPFVRAVLGRVAPVRAPSPIRPRAPSPIRPRSRSPVRSPVVPAFVLPRARSPVRSPVRSPRRRSRSPEPQPSAKRRRVARAIPVPAQPIRFPARVYADILLLAEEHPTDWPDYLGDVHGLGPVLMGRLFGR